MPEKVILHLDFDSFFASVEQQYNPLLRGKPVGVTATNGRTCIIAASKQAKQLGLKAPSNTYTAQLMCPEILLVSANFNTYWKISQHFLKICVDYTPYVEIFSIDEVFMDITSTAHLFGGAYNIIDRIKTRIKKEIGEYITISVGVSYNKMLAKLASGMHKPNGILEITALNKDTVYKTAQLTDICGIGDRIKERLNALGIYMLTDINNVPYNVLIQEFGIQEATFLRNVGLGKDETPVIPYTVLPTVKSVGRNYCLPKNEYNQRVILQNIYELSEEVGLKLRRLHKKAKTVGLSLKGNRSEHAHKTGSLYIHSGKDIFTLCHLLYAQWKWIEMVRMISVWAQNLEDSVHLPLSFFEHTQKTDRLLEIVDKMNDRFGDHTIRNGFLLYADKLTTVPNGYLADKYERTKLAHS